MKRSLIALAINVILALVALVVAYYAERLCYAITGQVWQLQLTAVGLVWFLVITILLVIFTILNGVDLSKIKNHTRDISSNNQQVKLPTFIDVFLQRKGLALVRVIVHTKAFWHRALIFTTALAALVLGIRGIGLQGIVQPKPNEVIFLKGDTPEAAKPTVQAALSVFFQNGSSQLSDANKLLVKQFAEMAMACQITSIELSGNTSSVPYADGNEIRNPGLANERIEAVQAIIQQVGKTKIATPFTRWGSEKAMSSQRWLLDLDSSGRRVLAAEYFNRRVDLLMKGKGKCQPPSPK